MTTTRLSGVLAPVVTPFTPRLAPGPQADETRPVATHDPAAVDPWLHTRGTPTPTAIEPGGVHDR